MDGLFDDLLIFKKISPEFEFRLDRKRFCLVEKIIFFVIMEAIWLSCNMSELLGSENEILMADNSLDYLGSDLLFVADCAGKRLFGLMKQLLKN